jgi:hypothetical protein
VNLSPPLLRSERRLSDRGHRSEVRAAQCEIPSLWRPAYGFDQQFSEEYQPSVISTAALLMPGLAGRRRSLTLPTNRSNYGGKRTAASSG